MPLPMLTVVIPSYNCAAYIAEAVDSIFRQNYPALEVIVVDDGSTDDTRAVLARFGSSIRILSQPNQGAASARNHGIRIAKGSFIGLLDADDLWTDDHVAVLQCYLLPESNYDLARGRTRTVQLVNGEPTVQGRDSFQPALVGACLFRASVFETVGLFNENMRLGEDFDWNFRLSESGCHEKRVDEVTLIYRRREGGAINSPEAIKRGQMDAIRRKLARAAKCSTS